MKKDNRGGARKNAGRKKSDIETTTISFRVPSAHALKLKSLLKKTITNYLNEISL